jgi:hypothetical protein
MALMKLTSFALAELYNLLVAVIIFAQSATLVAEFFSAVKEIRLG